MRLFLDQNLSPKTRDFLSSLGHDVTDTRREGMRKASDEEIMNFATREKRVILTFNGDFGSLLDFPLKEDYPGVIRLKVYPQTIEFLHPILEDFFAKKKPEEIEGSLVIIDNWRYRIRKF